MTFTINSVPGEDGFRMPGEFEDHQATWMLWPERPDNWRLGGKPAQRAFAKVAKAIAKSETIFMGVSREQFPNAWSQLHPEVRVVELSYNDSWMRDCGPTFVISDAGKIRGIDWNFNAWGGLKGGLYFPWDQDDLIPRKVLEIVGIDRYDAPIVLEGGSIHVDGEGTVLTTEECLLNPNRNPELSKEQIEDHLKEYLGARKVIWLGKGVYLDETSGHVDNLCCFIRPGVVALTWTDDKDDPQYEISVDAYGRLKDSEDAAGRKLEIHRIHQPDPVIITAEEAEGVDSIEGTLPRKEGDRMAASYINSYIATTRVIVPIFDDRHDEEAIKKYKELFPDREVVGVYAREILLGGGNIHCITQQQPKTGVK
jgi:agmatine deiminase